MANPFDRFDAKPNPFDRFDATTAQAATAAPAPSNFDDSYFAQGTSGVNEGIANTLGAPVDLMNAGLGLGARGINAMAGTNLSVPEKPYFGSEHIKGLMAPVIKPTTKELSKQMLRRVGQEVGAAVLPAGGVARGAAQPMQVVKQMIAPTLGSGAGAAVAQQVAPGNPYAEMAGQVIGGGIPTAIAAARAPRPVQSKAPTVEQLKADAGALYDKAEKSGAVVPHQETAAISTVMKNIAGREGVISPTGRVSTAYPKVSEALRTFDDYASGPMNMTQAKAARKTLANVASSLDPDERRIGSMMLDEFDNALAPIAPDLEEARRLWHTAKKGELIDDTIELAESKASAYGNSGLENALRTEFRALDRKIIKGQLRGLSDEEVAAIQRVARGGVIEDSVRYVGKLAPTGPVSLISGVGVPFAIGSAFGSPIVGAAAAAGASGIGYGAKYMASQLTKQNADIASEIVRGRVKLSPAARMLPANTRRALAGVLATQAATVPSQLAADPR